MQLIEGYISVIGGIIMDIKARPKGSVIPRNSNPASIYYAPGGVGRNIAENLARMGAPVRLFGAAGEDVMGEMILSLTSEAGVHTEAVKRISGFSTSVDISFLDQEGDLHLSYTDLDIAGQVNVPYLQDHQDILKKSAFLIADTNIPTESLQYLADLSEKYHIPLVIEPVSIQLMDKVNQLKGKIFLMTPNEREWEAFRSTRSLCTVQEVVISKGENGVEWHHISQTQNFPAFDTRVTDAIGAGDALVAGIVYGLWKAMAMAEAIRWGMAAATLTLQTEETVFRKISSGTLESFLADR